MENNWADLKIRQYSDNINQTVNSIVFNLIHKPEAVLNMFSKINQLT